MKCNVRNIYIWGIMLALAVTGCGKSSGVVVRNDNRAYVVQGSYEGSGSEAASEQQEPESTQPSETDVAETDATETDATENGSPAGKQPPEGFELKIEGSEWGVLPGDRGTQPLGNAAAEDLAWYNAYYIGRESEKVIYLTFNCGYDNANTGQILDALKKHSAPATFFVLGYFLENSPELVKRIAAEGHAVGSHTYSYLDMTKTSEEDFKKELSDVENKFYEITGTKLAPYYRPPLGRADAADIKLVNDLGYYTIFWSLSYMDWDRNDQPSRDKALEGLTSLVHPGAVVLLSSASRTNAEIMDELLTKWEEMGYSFRPLSELVSGE